MEFHKGSMELPWCLHEVPLRFHGVSMEVQWSFHGVP